MKIAHCCNCFAVVVVAVNSFMLNVLDMDWIHINTIDRILIVFVLKNF